VIATLRAALQWWRDSMDVGQAQGSDHPQHWLLKVCAPQGIS